jgi:hypothetical protein
MSATLVRDTATRLVFLNLVAGGTGGLVRDTAPSPADELRA